MDDLTITWWCAEAMGYKPRIHNQLVFLDGAFDSTVEYRPLHDDAQAMALIKKFHIALGWNHPGWAAFRQDTKKWVENADLNRAICECVANMAKASSEC